MIAAATAVAYAGSFLGAFQFDDIPAILDNPTVRRLWPLRVPLWPPTGALTVSGRPVLNLSLALNTAVSGYRPWSYHALNLLIHVGAALAIYGIARRTLARIGWARAGASALAIALIWAVHPLNTEAVTYIVQRAESLMGLFYLLTLYGFIRSVDAGRTRWLVFSVLCCLLGAGTKEVIVTAPVAVLLYDRTFVAKSWLGSWRARKAYYLALAATWVPLMALVASTGWNRGATSGFHVGVAWWPYWRSQGEAAARYLGLAFWPHPLVFDYGPSALPAGMADALFGLLAAAGLATAVGCWRGRPWAFLAGWCFLILSPTSVIPGVLQFVSEHRMYLPLAAVVTAAVLGVQAAADRFWGAGRGKEKALASLLVFSVVGLGGATAWRNRIYRTDLGLWLDTVAKRPLDPTAQADVAEALLNRGRTAEAIPYSLRSLSLDPWKPNPHYNLGLAYEKLGRWTAALQQFAAAAEINPKLFYAEFRAGRLLDRLGRPAEAEAFLRQALAVEPDYADAHGSLGVALEALGRPDEAIAEYRRALALDPDQPEVEFNLGLALAGRGQLGEAASHYAAAVRLRPQYGDAQLNLGVCLAQLGRPAESLAALRDAARLLPDSPEAQADFALALDQAGRTNEAIAAFRRALRLRPGYPEAHYNLGNALLHAHDLPGARAEFLEALRLRPNFDAAREVLDRLAPYFNGP